MTRLHIFSGSRPQPQGSTLLAVGTLYPAPC